MDIPDDLIELQRAADAEHSALQGLEGEEHAAQWERWREAAARVQAAVTEHAAAAGVGRFQVEAAVKKAARHSA